VNTPLPSRTQDRRVFNEPKERVGGENMVTCSCNELTFRTVVKGDVLSHVFIRNPIDVTYTIKSLSVDGTIKDSDLHIELKGNAMNTVDLLPYNIPVGSTVYLILTDGKQLPIQPGKREKITSNEK
jgi:hypothetical protein